MSTEFNQGPGSRGGVEPLWPLLFTASSGQELRCRAADRGDQKIVSHKRALLAGSQHGVQNALRCGAWPSAVATPNLAVHDGRADRLLSAIIRGCDFGIDQEPEPMHGMVQICRASRRFGACVKLPEATRSSWQLSSKPCSAKASPLSRRPRQARRSENA